MPEGTNLMSASDLMLTFLSHTSAHDVKYIGGLNPFTIKVDGEETFIYIKNLSPAQLSNNNPDIWRIQLPVRDDFEKIKESASPFVLLGYDKENDVYTTWNPYWCKQRLNVGKSVSLYSRLSLQKRVHETGEIEQLPLNNDGDVVCIPGNCIYEYLKDIKTYYPEETVFIAKNSSLQAKTSELKTPEELYNAFVDIEANMEKYSIFLESSGRTKSTISNYLNALNYVVQNGILEKYSSLFLGCLNYGQYQIPMKQLVATDDIKEKDVPWHGAIRAALNRYIEYWMRKSDSEPRQASLFNNEPEEPERYYELDEFGKIVALDEELVKLLIPYTKEEYPDYEIMSRIAENFYRPDITKKMNPFDWIKMFENLKKVKKGRIKKRKENTGYFQTDKGIQEISEAKMPRKVTILRVEFPDGKVIQYPSATDTYVEIIEDNYPDLIEEIDFGYVVISKEKLPDFKSTKRSQKQLSNGYYLSTNFSTETKADILKKISEELELNLKIDIVEKKKTL